MALSSVSFQPVTRAEVPANAQCTVCHETTAKDSGPAWQSWWAHPSNRTIQLTDYIHETCLKRISYFQDHCSGCQAPTNPNSLPVLSQKEKIGYPIYFAAPDIMQYMGLLISVSGVALYLLSSASSPTQLKALTDLCVPILILGQSMNSGVSESNRMLLLAYSVCVVPSAILFGSYLGAQGLAYPISVYTVTFIAGSIFGKLMPSAIRSVVEKQLLNEA